MQISILGCTGSIGTQTVDVCQQLGYRVTSLACHSQIDLLFEQIKQLQPYMVAVSQPAAALRLRQRLEAAGLECKVLTGEAGLETVARDPQAQMTVQAMVGMCGIKPVLAAIDSGHDIALANKEVLVAAGRLVLARARQQGIRLLPVDSEHSAIWQCLRSGHRSELKRIIITASGGPFRGYSEARLKEVTLAQALQHPTWKMGGKITIDSATLMNKGLEVIEAARLFDLTEDQIAVVVHPQSIVHSLVEWQDGSVIAQLGTTDMRLPIQYALTYPRRQPSARAGLDLNQTSALTFEAVDTATFPALDLAREALRRGGLAPAVFNAANEVAVQAFMAGKLDFCGISRLVSRLLYEYSILSTDEDLDLERILDTDRHIRQQAKELLEWKD
ncbi:1-deoxy-D-xylulose-5-phosphate reductoisomerase [Oscillospiraceae bacterium HV4-5-C5C]|nr:1-deoxy-D-xylulose-5-phosphate reductoisomerase [Oscillospiraceae bacterium HV4-5-C5C]